MIRGQDNEIRVEGLCLPAVAYSLALNGIGFLQNLRIHNISGRDLSGVSIGLRLLAEDGDLAHRCSDVFELLPQGGAAKVFSNGRPSNSSATSNFDLELQKISDRDDSYPATLKIDVATGSMSRPLEIRERIEVLPRNAWWSHPLLFETIASWVQPQSPLVMKVIHRASEILEDETGDASLAGYQTLGTSHPNTPARVAASIYQALWEMEINYINGALSADRGPVQKVKTTETVLSSRTGNCIDLAVTYAACLMHAGLNPIIWMVEGHAFSGLFLDDRGLGKACTTDTKQIFNYAKNRDSIMPVDVVGMSSGGSSIPFAQAVQRGRRHLEDHTTIRGMVDVKTAFQGSVMAFPSKSPEPPPELAVGGAGATGMPMGPGSIDADDHLKPRDVKRTKRDFPARLGTWVEALLQLDFNNPLLSAATRGVRFELPKQLQDGERSGMAVLDDLIHGPNEITLLPRDEVMTAFDRAKGADASDELLAGLLEREANPQVVAKLIRAKDKESEFRRYSGTLSQMLKDSVERQRRTGFNFLYLTFGYLEYPKKGGSVRAPLFLKPVSLAKESGSFSIKADGDELSVPNQPLIEFLRRKYEGISLPSLEEPLVDEHGLDIDRTLSKLSGELTELAGQLPSASIIEEAGLQLLPFAQFQIGRDLEKHWEKLFEAETVRHIAKTPKKRFKPFLDSSNSVVPDEASLLTPLPANGRQLSVIQAALEGHSFVLEGPPGTGKSDVISTIIALSMAKGKTVLFVTEKEGAAKVVHKRLQKMGLDPFVLDLWDSERELSRITEKLLGTAELLRTTTSPPPNWKQAAENFGSMVKQLEPYPKESVETRVAGLTLWEVTGRLIEKTSGSPSEAERIEIPESLLSMSDSEREIVRRSIGDIQNLVWEAGLGRGGERWSLSGLTNVEDLSEETLRVTSSRLEKSQLLLTELPEKLSTYLRAVPSPISLSVLATVRGAIDSGMDADDLEGLVSDDWAKSAKAIEDDARRINEVAIEILRIFEPSVLEDAPLGDICETLADLEQKRVVLGGKGRKLLALWGKLDKWAEVDATVPTDQIPALLQLMLDLKSRTKNLADEFKSLSVTGDFHSPVTDRGLKALEGSLQSAQGVREQCLRLVGQGEGIDATALAALAADDNVIEISSAWTEWLEVIRADTDTMKRWVSDRDWVDAWSKDGQEWYLAIADYGSRDLDRWIRLGNKLRELREAGLVDLVARVESSDLDPQAISETFDVSFLKEIQKRLLEKSVFRTFSSTEREARLKDYLEARKQVYREAGRHIKYQIVDRLKNLDPDRIEKLEKMIGTLKRADGMKTKTRKDPLTPRLLFQDYSDGVKALTQCVMMSPASVATVLQPDPELFDLVVFDEASQIRVAEAIGSLGRGRAAVVVGDSKQMPPSSNFSGGTGDEEFEPEKIQDEESILDECVASNFEQLRLSWHYRSSDESLISFSNSAYYEGDLLTIPNPYPPGKSPPHASVDMGVKLVRVQDGVYEDQINQPEAQRIVSDLSERLGSGDERSVAVVTTSKKQMEVVKGSIRDSGNEQLIARFDEEVAQEHGREAWIVLNLEEIQGDERDVVVFSWTRAKGSDKWGPLAHAGGERRLNVAITRARSLVLNYCSFDPREIPETATNRGVPDLRLYLLQAERNGRVDQEGETDERRDGSGGFTTEGLVIDDIARELSTRGLEVETSYGLSDFKVDLAVKSPGFDVWSIAVFLDTPSWASRSTVVDRDAARSDLDSARRQGAARWSGIESIYLPEWLKNRDEVSDRVVQRVKEAEETARQKFEEDRKKAEAARLSEEEEREAAPIPDDRGEETKTPAESTSSSNDEFPPILEWVKPLAYIDSRSSSQLNDEPKQPFIFFEPREVFDRAKIEIIEWDEHLQDQLFRLLDEIVETEGPVSLERLLDLTVRCFGLKRVSPKSANLIRPHVSQGRIVSASFGGFVWPEAIDRASWTGFRSFEYKDDAKMIPPEQRAPEEVVNAAFFVADQAGGTFDWDDLATNALRALGYPRVSGQYRERAKERFRAGLKVGRLIEIDGELGAGT